jgi:hypothetical protein
MQLEVRNVFKSLNLITSELFRKPLLLYSTIHSPNKVSKLCVAFLDFNYVSLLQFRKDGVWVGHLLSGYSVPMEDPKGETNVEIGGTWKQSIKAAYEATKSAFPGGEIIAHLDQK